MNALVRNEATRITLLALLGSISIMTLLVLPTVVGALVDFGGLTESEAGWAAAAGGFGGAFGAILIAVLIRHVNPRALAVAGLLVMVVFDAASSLMAQIPTWLFISLRAVSGFGGAAVYAAVMASYASMPDSERGYGVFMVLQFGLSAAGLYALPWFIPVIGISGLYLGMALISLTGLALVSSVRVRTHETDEARLDLSRLLKPAAILAMIGIGLFETANNMHFAYADRIGLAYQLDYETVGAILGFATLVGMPAAFAVVLLGDRFGELRPILIALAVAIGGLVLVDRGSGESVYIIAMCMVSIAWAFGMPYFQAFEAKLDPEGSVVVAGGFFTAGGGAAGPALAATLVLPGEYSRMLLAAIALYVVIGGLMCLAAYFQRRH